MMVILKQYDNINDIIEDYQIEFSEAEKIRLKSFAFDIITTQEKILIKMGVLK